MTPTSVKLYYLPLPARGDAIRLALKNAGIEFENIDVSLAELGGLKSELPFGQLPVLEVDGVKISQTLTICRYIAALSDGIPSDLKEAALVDMVATSTDDSKMMGFVFPTVIFKDEATFKENAAQLKDALPKYLSTWSNLLGSKSFFHGAKANYADFLVYCLMDMALRMVPDAYAAHSAMQEWHDRVKALPIVASYERPPCRDCSMWVN